MKLLVILLLASSVAIADNFPMGRPVYMKDMMVCKTEQDATIVARERNKSLNKGVAAMRLMMVADKCAIAAGTVTYTGISWQGEPFKVFSLKAGLTTYWEVSDWNPETI